MCSEVKTNLLYFIGLQISRVLFLISILRSRRQRRHIGDWLKSLRKDYFFTEPSPWLTFDAIDVLKHRLQTNVRVFEYGSGGSTLFWSHSGAQCVSVEHDPSWFSIVRKRLQPSDCVDIRLVIPEVSDINEGRCDPADPEHYVSADKAFRGYTFRTYVSQIDGFPNNYFDIILIDGRARPSCIMHSARKLKDGGLLILDNADESYYTAKTEKWLQNFSLVEFFGVGPYQVNMWKTNIYMKNKKTPCHTIEKVEI